MENTSIEKLCPFCHSPVLDNSCFCANCGKPLKNKPLGTSVLRQIIIYSISLFLPPLGYVYTWKYFRQSDNKSKMIALAAFVITTISLIVTIWLTQRLVTTVNQSINSLDGLYFNY